MTAGRDHASTFPGVDGNNLLVTAICDLLKGAWEAFVEYDVVICWRVQSSQKNRHGRPLGFGLPHMFRYRANLAFMHATDSTQTSSFRIPTLFILTACSLLSLFVSFYVPYCSFLRCGCLHSSVHTCIRTYVHTSMPQAENLICILGLPSPVKGLSSFITCSLSSLSSLSTKFRLIGRQPPALAYCGR